MKNNTKSTHHFTKNIKIFNSNDFQLQPLDTETSPSNEFSLNIYFINTLKKNLLKPYNNILIVNHNNILDKEIFDNINNDAEINICSTLEDLVKIKHDTQNTIKYDCIFLFCQKNHELKFLKYIVQSNEFYNIDLILPAEKTGRYKLNRKKFGLPIIIYSFPYTGVNRFIHQLNFFAQRLGWERQDLLIHNNLKHSKKYFSKNDSKSYIKNTSNIISGLIKHLDYFQYFNTLNWSFLTEVLNNKENNYVILMRDPRDIITSYYYFSDQPGQNLLYKNCSTIEAKLFTLLKGHFKYLPNLIPAYFLAWPSINEMMDLFLSILNLDYVHIIRFEDLHNNNTKTMKNLLTNLGLYPSIFQDFTEDNFIQSEYLSSFEYQTQNQQKRNPKNKKIIASCRKGVVGDWRSLFTSKIVDYIKETTGDKLIKLGYEKNMDWHL